MADQIISFSQRNRIGLIVRGKQSPTHHPDLMAQHADAILADGEPVGFYGEGNGGSTNRVGMSMDGIVYDLKAMKIKRPYYVDMAGAVANRVVSTVLLITVTPAQAKAFAASWTRMTVHPGSFNIVGGNCSTHASAAFIDAGILKGEIPGLDTPDRLYAQLCRRLPAGSWQSVTGFIGFRPAPTGGGGYDLVVKPYVDRPTITRPNPGSSGSLGGNHTSRP